ncbi:tetratricopeptide repeat protein [bacterium]|nr:tetratricopeptide repeat protein [bacterium]
MSKIIAITISLLVSSVLLAQSKEDSIKVFGSMVNHNVLVGLFNHDLGQVSIACNNDLQIVTEIKEKGDALYQLHITGDDYNIQTEIFEWEDGVEFSTIWINFRTPYEANKFLNYFAPIANFKDADNNGYWSRGFVETAQIHPESSNVVLINLRYPRFSKRTKISYFEIGLAKFNLKDYRGAIADYTRVIEIDPKYPKAYFNRGHSKGLLENYRGAIADYTKAIEIDPNDAAAYCNRGLSKLILDQTDGGCLDLSKAGELGYGRAYESIRLFCN